MTSQAMDIGDESLVGAGRAGDSSGGLAESSGHTRGELTRTAWMNSSVLIAEYGVRTVVAFFVTPMMLLSFGPAGFGVWQMIDRLASYLASMDGRSTQVLRWSVATSTNQTDMRRMVGAALCVWLTFLPVFLVGAGLLAWLTPALAPGVPAPVVVTVALLIGGGLAIAALAGIAEAVLAGMNLAYREVWITTTVPLLGGVSIIVLCRMGFSMRAVAIVQISAAAVTCIAFWWLSRRIVTGFGVARPPKTLVAEYLKKSLWFVCWMLIDRSLLAADVVLIGAVMTPALVSTYVISSYVSLLALNVSALGISAAAPGLGRLLARNDLARLRDLRREMKLMVIFVAGTAGTTIIALNQPFVGLWVGKGHDVGPLTTLLIVVGVVQWLLIRIDGSFIDLTLNLRSKVTAGAISAVIAVVAGGLLLRPFGLPGLCLGLIAGRAVMGVSYPLVVSRFLGEHSQPFTLVRPMSVVVVLWAAYALIGQSPVAWLRATAPVVATIAMFCAGLTGDDRSRLIDRVRATGLTRFGLFKGAHVATS